MATDTDTRANQLAAPDYLYIRLFIGLDVRAESHLRAKSVVTQRFGCVKAIKKKRCSD